MTNSTNVIKVGVMPGRIQEVAVEVGATIGSVLEIAGLETSGYEIKVDGVTSNVDALVTADTKLVLLTKQVKGNGLVKVGVMPGRIQEVAVEETQTIGDALALAELSADGYEIKVDGVTKTTSDVVGSAQLILLTKQVKGNATVKIGVMPGRINEFALDSTTTFNEALAIAELDASGYEVKADGTKVTDLNAQIGSTQLILLTKQVKGNAERLVKVGVMPGRISEVAVDSETTIGQVLELAGLEATGYEIKADGTTATADAKVGTANLILLTKQVKGNNNIEDIEAYVELTERENVEAWMERLSTDPKMN